MQKKAWTSASSPPKSIAIRSPTTQLPLQTAPQTPKKAPISIIPSSPMFTTPERSEKIPPIAAKASGVAKRSVEASTPTVRMLSRVSASFVWSQIAPSVPAIPRPIAHQPSLRSPRGTTAIPQASATNPGTSGPATERTVQGGSASQKARMPQAMPMMRDRARLGEPPNAVADRPLSRDCVLTASAPAAPRDPGRTSFLARQM